MEGHEEELLSSSFQELQMLPSADVMLLLMVAKKWGMRLICLPLFASFAATLCLPWSTWDLLHVAKRGINLAVRPTDSRGVLAFSAWLTQRYSCQTGNQGFKDTFIHQRVDKLTLNPTNLHRRDYKKETERKQRGSMENQLHVFKRWSTYLLCVNRIEETTFLQRKRYQLKMDLEFCVGLMSSFILLPLVVATHFNERVKEWDKTLLTPIM